MSASNTVKVFCLAFGVGDVLFVAVFGGGGIVGADDVDLIASVEDTPAEVGDRVGDRDEFEVDTAAEGGIVDLIDRVGNDD